MQQLDAHEYAETELVEIKIPFHVPYNTDWPDYRRQDGEMEIDGQHYNYVKIKISQDTIFLKCISNTAKDKLSIARNKVAKNVNNLPGNEDETTSIIKKANLLFGFKSDISQYQFSNITYFAKRGQSLQPPSLAKGFPGELVHPPSA